MSKRILVVDDQPDNRRIIRDRLASSFVRSFAADRRPGSSSK
jgi:CheY-like chemotaxis protein